MDKFYPALQRPAMLAFASALGSRESALRRDAVGDWSITGARGHVYAAPNGWQVFVTCRSAAGWTRAKKALAAARVCNDGDDEGAFIFDRLPTPAEAALIRYYCGIPKKREVGAAELSRLRSQGFAKAA